MSLPRLSWKPCGRAASSLRTRNPSELVNTCSPVPVLADEKGVSMKTIRTAALAIAGVLLLQTAALAGPPLICHPYNIGEARSLPFQGPEWSRVDPSYDVKHLLADTASLLTPETPVIVRMETLRRATLYSRNDAKLADALLQQIKGRADGYPAESREREALLAHFDLGYLAATYVEAGLVSGHGNSLWDFKQAVPSIDGYALVAKAIAQGGGPEMEFAAAVIASDRRVGASYQEHLQRALAGARPGTLLAQNIASHFPDAAKSAKLEVK